MNADERIAGLRKKFTVTNNAVTHALRWIPG